MPFDFDQAFGDALQAGINAAKPAGKAAENWVRDSTRANEDTLRSIAEGVADRQISKETAEMLLRANARALRSEAAALQVLLAAAAQAGIDAFVDTLFRSLKSALDLVL